MSSHLVRAPETHSFVAQHALIEEQTAKLAELKALSDSGNLRKPPFMTREDAEAETRTLSARVKHLTETLKTKDKLIADTNKEKDARIAELEEDGKPASAHHESQIAHNSFQFVCCVYS